MDGTKWNAIPPPPSSPYDLIAAAVQDACGTFRGMSPRRERSALPPSSALPLPLPPALGRPGTAIPMGITVQCATPALGSADIFRDTSPLRQGPPHRDVLSPGSLSPTRRAYCGGSGGPVRGREGLPGSFKESRAYSPREPRYREKEKAVERSVVGGIWSGKGGKEKSENSGLKLLHEAGGKKRDSSILVVMKHSDAPGETAEDASQRADRIQIELNQAKEEINRLRHGLLLCEHHAKPHTINAEYRMEWTPKPPGRDTIDPRNNEDLIEQAVDAVEGAVGRLHARVDSVLQELCDASQEILALQGKLEGRDEEVAALRLRCAELEKQVAELQAELEDCRLLEPQMRDLQAQVDRLTARVAELTKLNEKLQMELDQLRVEFARLARRKRATTKGKEEFLSTYLDEDKAAPPKGPAWVPTGAPYKHLLDEEAIRSHQPWLYSKAG